MGRFFYEEGRVFIKSQMKLNDGTPLNQRIEIPVEIESDNIIFDLPWGERHVWSKEA